MAGRGNREAFLWMAGLSVVTLALGAAREMWIARELRASGAADLFFRGLVVIGATRSIGLSVFRSRWIPAPREVGARHLVAGERRVSALLALTSVGVLLAIVGPGAWGDPSVWVAAASVIVALFGAALRALAERAGQLRRGFALDWALPIGAIAGAVLLPGGSLGPSLGILAGVMVAAIGQWTIAWGEGALAAPTALEAGAPSASSAVDPARSRALVVDALTYVNLGVVEAALSHVFAVGGFALINYASLFVNAALAVPSAASTVLALRAAAGDPAAAHARLRRWAVVGGLASAASVAAIGLALAWAPIAAIVDGAIGWNVSEEAGVLVLLSVPFAGLRLANTIGRQAQVAADPSRLLGWSLGGLAGRAVILGAGSQVIGVLASPLALGFAELVQVGGWWRRPATRPGGSGP